MIKNNLYKVLVIVLATSILACDSDDEVTPSGKYENGILISNEGNFSDVDGSVGYLGRSMDSPSNKIFEAENGRPFGGLLQSIGLHGGHAYLLDNLGNKMEIVDANTFESVSTILSGLTIPRYFVAEGAVGYISNWGPYAHDFSSPGSFLAVLDMDENLLGQQIPVPSRPEGLIISSGKLFVSSAATDSITVIDIATGEKTTSIKVGFGSSQFVKDRNGHLWVACTSGSLFQIDPGTNTVLQEIGFANINGNIAIDGAGETIYLLTNVYAMDFSYTENEIVKLNISTPENYTTIFSSRNIYALGVDPVTNTVYLGNSNAFQGNGTVIRIDNDGNEIDNFAAGRAPNGFVFR